jgi:4-amino-4-deoxy-L-arabinose transferase-like glycosyltransferase
MNERQVQWLERFALFAAVVTRVCGGWSLSKTGHGRHTLVDASTYWSQAGQLSAGKNPFKDGFYQPPGYPILLSWLQSAFGENLWAPRCVQLALGVLTVWALIRLGRRLGGQKVPYAGGLAGLLYALYGPPLMFELDLLTPAVTAAVTVAMLWLMRGGGKPLGIAVAAAVAGLASAVHPTFLVLGLVLVVFPLLGAPRKVTAVLPGLLGLVIGLMPMTQANIDRFEQVRFTSTNAGINFYLGNSSDWKRTSFIRPGLGFRKLALEAEPHRRDGFERNSYWRSRAFSDIAAAPHRWLLAMGTKAVWSVNNTEIPRNEDHRCRTVSGPLAWMGWMPVRYGLVFPLAFLGAVGLWRRQREDRFVVVAWAALHLPVVLFIVAARYRIATWPMMCLLAPLGLSQVRAWAGAAGLKGRWPWLGVLVLPFLPIDSKTEMDPAWCAHVEANLSFMDGDFEAAETRYQRAVDLDPNDWSARHWLAVTMMKRRGMGEAVEQVDAILEGFPDSFPMLKLRASLAERMGDPALAAEFMLSAYRVGGDRSRTGMQVLRLWEASAQDDRIGALLATDEKLARRWAQRKGPL